jgi:hypothetical protein
LLRLADLAKIFIRCWKFHLGRATLFNH